MKNWRLTWAFKQIFTLSTYLRHRKILTFPGMFWVALILKLYPGLYKRPVILSLKKGGNFAVRDFMSLYIYNEIFVEAIYDDPILEKSDPVIMDIGANTGLFALRMKQLYPEASIYCFEPFPPNFQDLSQNIKSSELRGVQVFQNGIGETSREEKLFINKRNIGGHSLFSSEAGSDEYVHVEIISLEKAMEKLSAGYCDLMKMDCEGAEYEIIKSITPHLASRIGLMIFEATGNIYDITDLISHLKGLNFTVRYVENTCNYIAVNNRETPNT